MASVTLQGIGKVYENGMVAVENFDLTIKDGELMVLVGPSGCGKSSVLRMIAGLEEISSGTLLINDRRMNDVSPVTRNIAMVFQNYALYPHMTVRNNIELSLKLRHIPKRDRKLKVEETAALLDLTEVLERRPGQLSGGQRQRVAMGRAIVRDPSVFLLDEPLSNLDAKLRAQVRREISNLQERLSSTMIFVTHDQVEAMTMADRIVVMKNGRVQQVGTPNELYESPVNLFVADFIGSPAMNFLKGHLITNGNSLKFGLLDEQNLELLNLEIERGSEASGSTEKMVIIGLRPEHLLITGVGSGVAGIRAKVRSIEPLGGEAIVHVDLYKNLDPGNCALAAQVDAGDANDSELLSQLRNQLVIKTQGQFRFKIGEEIVISLNSDASAYLFDIETQLAITGIVRKS